MSRIAMFNVGDDAIVTQEIRRMDWRSKVLVGERVKITNVWVGENYTVVAIQPYSGKPPMIDICCDHTGPLRKVNK